MVFAKVKGVKLAQLCHLASPIECGDLYCPYLTPLEAKVEINVYEVKAHVDKSCIQNEYMEEVAGQWIPDIGNTHGRNTMYLKL